MADMIFHCWYHSFITFEISAHVLKKCRIILCQHIRRFCPLRNMTEHFFGSAKNRISLQKFRRDTISHKMVQNALNETRGQDTVIIRSRSSSMSALGNILETHAGPKS